MSRDQTPTGDRRTTAQNGDEAGDRPAGGADEPEQYDVGSFGFGKTMEPRTEGPGWDPEQAPDSGEENEPEPPWYVYWVGQIGVYLAVVAVALAASGVTLAWLGVYPYGNVAITFSLVFGVLAMLLGIVFQVYRSDFDAPAPS